MTIQVVLNPDVVAYFIYMALALGIALPWLYHNTHKYSKCTHRKLFHILAFCLFTPLLTQVHANRAVYRFTVFAFNAVSVLLIMIEQARVEFKHPAVDHFFKHFSDEREITADGYIVTHLYLLMGCAMPLTMSFILFDGGLLNSEFMTISFCGVAFLGVGDVSAALYGRAFGRAKWFSNGKKTREGTMACVLSLGVFYAVLTHLTASY